MEKNISQRGVVVGNLVKTAVFALAAAGILLANFFYEGGLASALPEVSQVDELAESRIITRFTDAEASLAQKTAEGFYEFDLKQGRVWVNLTGATEEVRFRVAEKVLIEANRAVFDLRYQGNDLEVEVYDGDLYLSFVDGQEVLNSLLLPRASSLRIGLKKIDQRIGPLLPNKLQKEFFYAAIGDQGEDEFVRKNLAEDRRFFAELKRNFRSEVARKEPQEASGFVNEVLDFAEANLTFVPAKRKALAEDNLRQHLDNALFYANAGSEAKVKEQLADFRAAAVGVGDLREILVDYLDRLAIFNFGDPEYEVYLALLQVSDAKGQADLLDVYWFNVYKGVDEGAVSAQAALDLYLEKFDQLLSPSDPGYQQYLAEQNQLFDNLFLRFPLFYRDGYFALKERIEKELLKFYEGQAAEELKQAFVDQKIDFLKRLRRYFFDGEVEVAEAKKIFRRLMNGAKALLPAEGGSVAVIALFEAELTDIEDFWGYLSSADYQTKFYGSTHEERYEAYLKERTQVFDFDDLREGVFGEVTEEVVSTEELAAKVEDVLAAKAEISAVVIEAEDAKERYLPISAVIGGYPFKALFDRDTELLSEVFVYDEEVSKRPIQAERLFGVIAQKFGDLAEDSAVDASEEELAVESVAARRARLYVAEVLSELGLEVGIEDVSTVSASEAIYRVSEVFLADSDEEVRASFEVLMNGEKVRGLFMTISGEPQLLEGEFTFEELALILEAEMKFLGNGQKYDAEVLLGRKEGEKKIRR